MHKDSWVKGRCWWLRWRGPLGEALRQLSLRGPLGEALRQLRLRGPLGEVALRQLRLRVSRGGCGGRGHG